MGNFIRDLIIILLGIIITILLVRIGALEHVLSYAQGSAYIGSFIAGIFFTSVFTIAPSAVALAKLAEFADPYTVALWGAFGAMLGDLILFLFVRDIFYDDLMRAMKLRGIKKFFTRFHFAPLRWTLPIIGALIIASPLPDELGIGLMGIAKIGARELAVITFVMNYIGILAVASVASVL